MSRTEIAQLVEEKFERQQKLDPVNILKTVECEVGNLLDGNVLCPERAETFQWLMGLVTTAIKQNEPER